MPSNKQLVMVKVMHGEAVAIGMVQISRVAEKNLMPQGITRQIAEIV